jgi:hypothetical protein
MSKLLIDNIILKICQFDLYNHFKSNRIYLLTILILIINLKGRAQSIINLGPDINVVSGSTDTKQIEILGVDTVLAPSIYVLLPKISSI